MMVEAVARFVEQLGQTFRVDPDRVAMSGSGTGAAGAWMVVGRNPERFASVAVVSPRGAPLGGEDAGKLRHLYASVAAAQNDKEGYGVYLASVDALGKAKAELQFRTNGNNAAESARWFYSDNGTWDWLNNHKRRTADEVKQRDERDAKELAEALAAVPKFPGQYKLKFSTWVGDKRLEFPYQVTLPRGYDATAKQVWPTILFLAGAGEQAADLSAINSHGPCAKMRDDPAFREWCPFIVVSPQHDNSPERAKAIVELLDDLQTKLRMDPDRVYCTGLSLGGTTTWTVSNAAPDKFAAIAPMNGRDRCVDVAAKNLKYVPTWIVAGGADGDFYNGSVHMHQILSEAGNDVHMTVIPNEGHSSWVRYYNDRRFYDWLLQHRRLSASERTERDRYPTTAPSSMLADASRHPEVLKPGEHWLEFATHLGGQPYAMRYCVYLPQDYSPDRGSWPVMMYLHPDDVRDTDQSMIFQWGSGVDPRREAGARSPFPMIGLVPQLPHDRQWNDPEVMAMTQALLNEVGRRYRVDADRTYAVGLQAGANGAWSMAMQSPGRFAAVVAYQGAAVRPDEVGLKLRGVAARIMAPAQDGGAVNAAKQMAEAMKKAGGEVRLDQVADAQDPNHWTPFYTDPDLVKWLLAHRRGGQPTRMVKIE
jgi:predicted peptidase